MIKLKRNYEGKSFIYDGIEEVKLFRLVDADSCFFQASCGNINVRFYGINAPEVTKKIEPFGKEARDFALARLSNAYKIVIESDGETPIFDLTGKRYLAYVWYKLDEQSDFILYNEEILKEGYANLLLFDNVVKYRSLLIDASNEAIKQHLNLFSEDLNVDSFKVKEEVPLYQLINKIESYSDGRSVITKGIISLITGKSFFLEDHSTSTTYGTYAYNNYCDVSQLEIGDEVSFTCQPVVDPTFGKQLTNIRNLKILSKGHKIVIDQIETEEEVMSHIGRVVSLKEVNVFQKANCNKKYNSFYLKVILPFGDPLNIKIFKDTIDAPSFASVIQHKDYDCMGGLALYTSSISEGPKPWLILGNGSKKTFVKINN